MHHTWTHIRRLVASIMLVAFASFVLHGSAMARPAPMQSAAGAVTQHRHSAHDHGIGAHADHAAAERHHDSNAPDHHGATGACCGSFCATAIAPFARDVAVCRVETSVAVPSFEADGHGIAGESPRKPPRTPDIA